MNTTLKCLLLDDELPGLTYLKMLCEAIPELEVVRAFNNPEQFRRELPALDFDLCITDIEMPGMSGLEIARLLSGKSIIFTTAYKEYAAEAFDLNAVDYVRKPVTRERLLQAVAKARDRQVVQRGGPSFVQLNTDKGRALLYFDQLCYIRASEVDSRDKVARLADGSLLTLKNIPFKKLHRLLPDRDFVRINKKEIIAVKTVQVFSFDEITTTMTDASGEPVKLALGEVYRPGFMNRLKG